MEGRRQVFPFGENIGKDSVTMFSFAALTACTLAAYWGAKIVVEVDTDLFLETSLR